MNYFILIIVAIVSFIIGRMTAKNDGMLGKEELSEMQKDAREALTERTEKRKEKIIYILENAAVHQEELMACGVEDIAKGITSANVEKLLDVSNATARKYLNELERENKIKQIGTSGEGVYYTLFHQN